MQSMRVLVITGTLALVIGLLAMFPARVAIEWFAPGGVTFSNSSGTIWSGRAAGASTGGITLRNIEWRFKPLSLFKGQLAFAVSANPPSGFMDAVAGVGFGGSMVLSDLNASLPLSLVGRGVGVAGLQGTSTLRFSRIVWDGAWVAGADGVLQVADLLVPAVGRDSLGGYRAEFSTTERGIVASVEDTDAVIDLAGSLTLEEDRSYALIAQIVAQPSTPDSIKRQLKFLPPPNDRGQQEIRLEGVF